MIRIFTLIGTKKFGSSEFSMENRFYYIIKSSVFRNFCHFLKFKIKSIINKLVKMQIFPASQILIYLLAPLHSGDPMDYTLRMSIFYFLLSRKIKSIIICLVVSSKVSFIRNIPPTSANTLKIFKVILYHLLLEGEGYPE